MRVEIAGDWMTPFGRYRIVCMYVLYYVCMFGIYVYVYVLYVCTILNLSTQTYITYMYVINVCMYVWYECFPLK